MSTSSRHVTRKRLLAAAVASALLLPTATADAWWAGGLPAAWGWDPQEAYLTEYGFLDPYGPTPGDIRRMHRDNWKAMWGTPVYVDGVGPYGPDPSDVRRQVHRKQRRAWGYAF